MLWEVLKLVVRPSTTCTLVTTGWVVLQFEAAVGKMKASAGMFPIATMACLEPGGWEGWMEPGAHLTGAVTANGCGEEAEGLGTVFEGGLLVDLDWPTEGFGLSPGWATFDWGEVEDWGDAVDEGGTGLEVDAVWGTGSVSLEGSFWV